MPFDGAPDIVGRVAATKPTGKRKRGPKSKLAERQPIEPEVVEALRALQHVNLNYAAPSALTVIGDALLVAAQGDDVGGLAKVEAAARRYLRRKPSPTLAPTRSEAVHVLHAIVARPMSSKRDRYRVTLELMQQLDIIGRSVISLKKQMLGSRELYQRLTTEIEKAMNREADAEGLVVAALVAWGADRPTARRIVQDAFRRRD